MANIVIKKIVPPVAEGQESNENQIIKEGINQVVKSLKEKGYFTMEKEEIEGYKVVTLKIDGLVDITEDN